MTETLTLDEPGVFANPDIPSTTRADLVTPIAEIAATRPDRLAITGPDGQLTYGSLLAQARALAAALAAGGVGAGDRVAVCVPRSAALAVGALGVVMAGAAYVALDPSHPPARLRLLLERSGSAAAVVSAAADVAIDADLAFAIDASAGTVLCKGKPAGDPAPAPVVTRSGSDPAYVVFTSGSTGMPKGVVNSHAGLANLARWHQRAFGLTAGDRCALIASPAFDASIWELWPALASGACLVAVPDEVRTDPFGLRDWLVEQGITVTFVPTAIAEPLLAIEWPARTALRYLLTGGDVLRVRPAPELPFKLINNYGVSEAAVVSTSGLVAPDGPAGSTAAPTIGAAIDGVFLAVVDADLVPVADAEPGELLVGGDAVALGYLAEPELTARAFLTTDRLPVQRGGSDPGGSIRWYRTGDLVRRTPAGEYEHLGRLDEQLQLRGARIELGEIAAVLNRYPAISTSVVTAVDRGNGQQLVGYVVAARDQPLDRGNLWEFLAGQLPENMIPGSVVELDALPVTTNGKVDRQVLAEPGTGDRLLPPGELANRRRADADPDPDTDTDMDIDTVDPQILGLVAGIVSELLALHEVAEDDDFFLLGGHSMLGAQLIARLDLIFGVQIPLRRLFHNPTVAGIAEEVERAMLEDIEVTGDTEAGAPAVPASKS